LGRSAKFVQVEEEETKNRTHVVEVPQHSIGDLGTSVVSVLMKEEKRSVRFQKRGGMRKGEKRKTHVLEQLSKLSDLSGLLDLSELNHLLVDLGSEGVSHIENVGDTC